ncbi:MAG: rod shape-determining protein MreC [Firmicutes bacterium]|nr:rod shape-determining protein MreC [Bacillota bacterium]
MRPFTQKKALIILLVVGFLFITWSIFYTSQERTELTWAEYLVRWVLFPLQKAANSVVSFAVDTWEAICSLARVHRENYELREELVRLELRLAQLEGLKAENNRLREVAGFQTETDLQLLPAEVIGRSPSPWMETLIIDKGEKDGLVKNMPVISKEGVVGRLLRVGPNSSEVILLTDSRDGNSMSGVIERTRDLVYIYGYSTGRKGYCLVKPSDLDVDIRVGDRILTSGASLHFPRNLVVGVVQEVRGHDDVFSREALMKPAVNFSRLEYVFVVKD